MNRTKKGDVVAGIQERLTRLPHLYLTDFTGLPVKAMTDLRRRLRAAGVEYVVVKNTLAQRALDASAVGSLASGLIGPTGFVFTDDPIAAAKVLTDFQKDASALQVKAGLVDGAPVTADDVKRLARLPSRDELLGQLAGGLQSPLQGFVGALNGLLFHMVGALEALRAPRADAA